MSTKERKRKGRFERIKKILKNSLRLGGKTASTEDIHKSNKKQIRKVKRKNEGENLKVFLGEILLTVIMDISRLQVSSS